jgi:hypothetical protein
MKTMTMTPAAKASIKPAPASESMPLEGRAALDLYLGKINQNIGAIQAQLVVFERMLQLQKMLLRAAQSSETNNAVEPAAAGDKTLSAPTSVVPPTAGTQYPSTT